MLWHPPPSQGLAGSEWATTRIGPLPSTQSVTPHCEAVSMAATHSHLSVISVGSVACAAASRRQRRAMAVGKGARRPINHVRRREVVLGSLVVAGRFVCALGRDISTVAF